LRGEFDHPVALGLLSNPHPSWQVGGEDAAVRSLVRTAERELAEARNPDAPKPKNSASAEEYFICAGIELDQHTYALCIADASRAIELRPGDAAAYRLRGDARRQQVEQAGRSDYEPAIADFSRAIALKPDWADAYLGRGTARLLIGDDSGALLDAAKAIELRPAAPEGYFLRAAIKLKGRNARAAIADYDEAISRGGINPSDLLKIYIGRACAKDIIGDYAGAIRDYDQAIAIKPDYAAAYYNRGIANSKQHENAVAISDYNRAIALNPDWSNPYVGRARAKCAVRDFSGAINDCDMAFDKLGRDRTAGLRPTRSNIYDYRARCRAALGDYEGATSDYDRAIAIDGEESRYAFFFRAVMMHRLKREGATTELAKLIPRWPQDWTKNVGRYLLGELSEPDFLAAADQGDAKEINGQHCEAFFYTGMAHLDRGETDVAKDLLAKSVATEQRNFVEYQLAEVELERLDPRREETLQKPAAPILPSTAVPKNSSKELNAQRKLLQEQDAKIAENQARLDAAMKDIDAEGAATPATDQSSSQPAN
jgi:tetratricopeptide (TPR) repeat protein